MPRIRDGWRAQLVNQHQEQVASVELKGEGWDLDDLLHRIDQGLVGRMLVANDTHQLVITQITRAPTDQDHGR